MAKEASARGGTGLPVLVRSGRLVRPARVDRQHAEGGAAI